MKSPRHSGCSGRGHTSSVMSWSTPTAASATTQGSGDGSSDISTECFPWSPTDHEPQLEHWRGAWLWHAAKLVLTALWSRPLSGRWQGVGVRPSLAGRWGQTVGRALGSDRVWQGVGRALGRALGSDRWQGVGPGRPGWLPTQVPHRSGLAHHVHPVPHLMNSRPARSVVGTWTWFRSRCTCQVSLQRLMREAPPSLDLSFTHISLLTEVLIVINLAAIFHNTVHLFELSTETREYTIIL